MGRKKTKAHPWYERNDRRPLNSFQEASRIAAFLLGLSALLLALAEIVRIARSE